MTIKWTFSAFKFEIRVFAIRHFNPFQIICHFMETINFLFDDHSLLFFHPLFPLFLSGVRGCRREKNRIPKIVVIEFEYVTNRNWTLYSIRKWIHPILSHVHCSVQYNWSKLCVQNSIIQSIFDIDTESLNEWWDYFTETVPCKRKSKTQRNCIPLDLEFHLAKPRKKSMFWSQLVQRTMHQGYDKQNTKRKKNQWKMSMQITFIISTLLRWWIACFLLSQYIGSENIFQSIERE